METTRRSVLLFAGGSAVGVLFTPAPWRLITDAALWSETWPGVPVPERRELHTRYTNCSLCAAGCAMRVRCSGDQPISLAGVPQHPLSKGALCAFGLAAHHLPYHPARLKQGPVQDATAAVAAAIAKCGPGEHVVTLDLRPGRTASWTSRRAMAAVKNGVYATASGGFDAAVDLTKVRTVVSFGVPVLDGWGTPGNVIAARAGFRLIQVEPVESRTASMADVWLRIRPGSEDVLAQAFSGAVTPAAASEVTGIPESQIAALATELKQAGPVLVLGTSAMESSPGTIVARREAPVPAEWQKAAPITEFASLSDGSIRVLLIDESTAGDYLPWPAIEKKLVNDGAVVVAFTSSQEGYARHAQYALPVGVFPEVAEDVPPAVDSPAAAFRISTSLVAEPAGIVKPEQFIAQAAGLTIGETLRERADAIHQAGRGTLFTYADGKSAAVKDIKADDFWKALNTGGCWIDAADGKAPAVRMAAVSPAKPVAETPDLPLVVVFTRELPPASPILSKVYQESNLRLAPNRVALNPSCGLEDGTAATLQTVLGKCPVEVTLDAGIPPGAVQVTALPAVLDLCASGARAKVVRS